jgi:hypothetical protein
MIQIAQSIANTHTTNLPLEIMPIGPSVGEIWSAEAKKQSKHRSGWEREKLISYAG